jgi:hypothetical protein
VVAAGIALVNMGSALLLGALFRYRNLSAKEKQVGAWLALAIFAVATIFCNALFASFRSEYQLVADPSEAAQVSDAFRRAWPEAVAIFRANMVVKDQMSFVLFILGVILSLLAFWKGYTIDDKYPDHGRKDRRYRELLNEEQRMQETARQKVKELLHHRKAAVHAAIQEPATQVGMLARRIADLQHARTTLESQAHAIEREYVMVVEAYRHANTSVRAVPPPPYFKERPELSLRVDVTASEKVAGHLVAVQAEVKERAERTKDPLHLRLQALQDDTSEVLKRTMAAFLSEVQKEDEESVAGSVQAIHRIKVA